jgi:predicted ribosome-associated RNA-binding protein Tma20
MALDQELELQKLSGQKTNLLVSAANPLLFVADGLKPDSLVLPSLYLMFEAHVQGLAHGLLAVFIKNGVEDFLFNGADLMWPGILCLSSQDFKQGQIAVVYALNETLLTQIEKLRVTEQSEEQPDCDDDDEKEQSIEQLLGRFAPVAVGRMTSSPDNVVLNKGNGRRQGKAILVDHVLFDALWMHGDKKIPDKLVQAAPSVVEETKEFSLSGEEMAARIEEAFARCVLELVEPTALPLEPSTFVSSYLGMYLDPEAGKLSLKQSSFKKIGKLLESMAERGLIDYRCSNSDHKLITAVHKQAAWFGQFVPRFSLKKVKPQKQEAVQECIYPKVLVQEVYTLDKVAQQIQSLLSESSAK